MLKFISTVLLVIFACVTGIAQALSPTVADPAILLYNGTYYLYGTGGGARDAGFNYFTSQDLVNWKAGGYALQRGQAYGTKGFWAPQVFLFKGIFYMAYTADEHIAIAKAASPAGPFRQKHLLPLDTSQRMIDPYIFIENNKIYLYHVRLNDGNRIYVAELTADFSAIKNNTLKEIIHASLPWENTGAVSWKVTEGPAVFKYKSMYYLLYSANDFRSPDYAVGYATANKPEGPWAKAPGPIITKNIAGINGPGHGDVFFDKNNTLQYIFHTHNSNTSVAPRKTFITKLIFQNNKKRYSLAADSLSIHQL